MAVYKYAKFLCILNVFYCTYRACFLAYVGLRVKKLGFVCLFGPDTIAEHSVILIEQSCRYAIHVLYYF